MLLVHGTDALDIFSALIHLLKMKCLELFGRSIRISCSEEGFERDMDVLKDFFKTLDIRLIWNVSDTRTAGACGPVCVLKDYRLWMRTACNRHLSIGFDYDFSLASPSHLE